MKTLTQSTIINATPKQIYQVLMDSKLHGKITGDKAVIGKKVGDLFSAFSKYITGYNLFLVVNETIIQAWHASDWEKDEWSIVEYHLEPLKKGGTKINFVHSNVPDRHAKDIASGWKDYYWKPLEEYFTKPAKKKK